MPYPDNFGSRDWVSRIVEIINQHSRMGAVRLEDGTGVIWEDDSNGNPIHLAQINIRAEMVLEQD